ncbi:MAG: metal ABC transporter permease [Gammaproteobacteria bacterium]|nr:metal ABC transporter permease [Gammaproteobacteria bacterium]MDH5260996.1 metal ABC transporter permease [Gammaproteobacteria bacterium]MDH5456015.1 metal ABC transporter permease [Gammaproteobacteria bacterium]MDH5582343.1 metal ABC transporter permease [Gammaproteobacteria bacterium]
MDAINWSIDWTIVGPAFLAGLVVLSTHVPLGQEVLRRGIIFIDLAIAQVAGLGVIAAHAMDWDPNGLEVELAAVSAALLAAIGLHWTEKRWPQIQEPIIGVLFILAATGGILLLAGNPHGSEHLKELLVGQILWTTWSSIWPVAILYALVLTAWFLLRSRFSGLTFYLAFAVVVTASVQIVGIYLVFASLIIPALATTGLRRGNRLVAGYSVGAVSYLVGILLSFRLDLPTGAVIVWSMAAVAILAGLLISDKRPVDQP